MLAELKKTSSTLIAGLVLLLIALSFLYIWPGPYRYQYTFRERRITQPEGYRTNVLVKIDRLTGKLWVYAGGEYKLLGDTEFWQAADGSDLLAH